MAILDIVLLICFVPAVVNGISKGLVKQFADLVAILVGAWLAFKFSSMLSVLLSNYFTFDKTVLHIVSFILIIAVFALLLSLLGGLISKILKDVSLGWLNRIGGAVFGVAKTALVLGVIIMAFEGLCSSLHLLREGALDDAVVYQALRGFAQKVFPYLRQFVTGING